MSSNPMPIELRIAEKTDFPAISKVFIDAIENKASDFYNADQINAWTVSVIDVGRWEEKIETHLFIVAVEGDVIVGFASLIDCKIDTMYVHTQHHRKGIATLLLDYLLSVAREKGCTKVISHVSEAAKPFFVYKGFKVLQNDTFMMRGVEIWNYSVELGLG